VVETHDVVAALVHFRVHRTGDPTEVSSGAQR
jgi:hypothetical protein